MKRTTLTCSQCGAPMKKGRKAKGGGCLLALLGFIALIFFPIGTIIGVLFILGAFLIGNEYYWVCTNCKYKIPRDTDWWEFW